MHDCDDEGIESVQRHYKGIIYHIFVHIVTMVLNRFVFKFANERLSLYNIRGALNKRHSL